MKVRPLQDVILISIEPEQKNYGSIVLPDSAAEPVRVGTVLAVGPGKHWRNRRTKKSMFRPIEVIVGERIAFFMANLQTKQGKQICHVLEDGQGLIRETDVLFVIPPGEKLDISV